MEAKINPHWNVERRAKAVNMEQLFISAERVKSAGPSPESSSSSLHIKRKTRDGALMQEIELTSPEEIRVLMNVLQEVMT